jgi:RNA polymerase sigma-70 factor (ECF subfamily)
VSSQHSDQQLVERVQRGDKRAFDLLVLKYQHKIFGLISRYLRDTSEIQDVAQEAFIKAYRALPNFRGDSAFYTWLYRIAINTAKNHLMSKSRRPPGTDIDVEDAQYFEGDSPLRDIENPENTLYAEELKQVVASAMNQLPEDLCTAVTLREFEGLSYEDIADVMECPVGTVRSRIFRAREAIDREVKLQMQGMGHGAPKHQTVALEVVK